MNKSILLEAGKAPALQLPTLEDKNLTCLLYIFNGSAKVNDEIDPVKKDSLLIKNESIQIRTNEITDLVLFITDENSICFDGGIFSGNKI